MTVSISFPDDIARKLHERAANTGQDVATVVREVVAESLSGSEDSTAQAQATGDFADWLDAWIALHPVLDHAIDDSRESIYAGRGE